MNQRLVSPGAEIPSVEIAISGNASRNSAAPLTGSFNYSLSKVGTTTTGQITWLTVPLTPFAVHTCSGWFRTATGTTGTLRVEVDRGDGTFVPVANIGTTFGGAYQQVTMASFVAVGKLGRFRLRTIATGAGTTTWNVDDLSVEGPLVSSWAAHSALYTALAGINGSSGGFYHDLQGRVYLRAMTPQDAEKPIKYPWICVPLLEEDEQPTIYGRGEMLTTWTVRIYAFVAETSNDKMNTATVEAAYKLKDDIKKVILSNVTLSGTVTDLEIARINTIAGADPTMTWGEVLFELRLQQKAQASDLGV